jgi:adenylyltransferase/sulfurtransferase
MQNVEDTCASLRAQIAATEAQLASLKRDLANAEAAAKPETGSTGNPHEGQNGTGSRWPLLQEEYKRYGRQMIVSQVGLRGSLDIP